MIALYGKYVYGVGGPPRTFLCLPFDVPILTHTHTEIHAHAQEPMSFRAKKRMKTVLFSSKRKRKHFGLKVKSRNENEIFMRGVADALPYPMRITFAKDNIGRQREFRLMINSATAINMLFSTGIYS